MFSSPTSPISNLPKSPTTSSRSLESFRVSCGFKRDICDTWLEKNKNRKPNRRSSLMVRPPHTVTYVPVARVRNPRYCQWNVLVYALCISIWCGCKSRAAFMGLIIVLRVRIKIYNYYRNFSHHVFVWPMFRNVSNNTCKVWNKITCTMKGSIAVWLTGKLAALIH